MAGYLGQAHTTISNTRRFLQEDKSDEIAWLIEEGFVHDDTRAKPDPANNQSGIRARSIFRAEEFVILTAASFLTALDNPHTMICLVKGVG